MNLYKNLVCVWGGVGGGGREGGGGVRDHKSQNQTVTSSFMSG